jgi:hypothetical protein
MTPADLRAAVLAGLAAVEDLAAEVGLGLQSVADQVEAAHLAAALTDARVAADSLRALLARLPADREDAADE